MLRGHGLLGQHDRIARKPTVPTAVPARATTHGILYLVMLGAPELTLSSAEVDHHDKCVEPILVTLVLRVLQK